MKNFGNSAASHAPRKSQLSKDEFEQICFEASRDITCCAEYLRNILAGLRIRLSINPLLLPPNIEDGVDNPQAVVVTVYHLLDEECECDFDIMEVLNSYAVDLDEGA